jgi:hypothetical protein
MTPFQQLSPDEQEVVRQAVLEIADGPRIDECEFHTRFGVERTGFKAVLARWPDVDDSDEHSDDTLVLNGALNEVCYGGLFGSENWQKMFVVSIEEVTRIYEKWYGLRTWHDS